MGTRPPLLMPKAIVIAPVREDALTTSSRCHYALQKFLENGEEVMAEFESDRTTGLV